MESIRPVRQAQGRQAQDRREFKPPGPGFWTVTLVFAAFCLLLKLSTWNFPHNRGDEPIYWQVSQNLVQKGEYNILGSPILEKLPPHMYHRKLFTHPPLYPLLLVPFVVYGSAQSAILISWLSHALCIIALALLLRSMLQNGPEGFDAMSPCFWVPLLGLSVDPFFAHMSSKLWIDGPLTALIAFSMALFVTAEHARRRRWVLLAAGTVLGLAALSKLVAVLALPIAAAILWHQACGQLRRFVRSAVLGFLPVALLVLPWLIVFYREYGELTPSWIQTPGEWKVKNIPFVDVTFQRPFLYYWVKTGMIQPLFLLGIAFGLNRRIFDNFTYRIGLIWCLVFMAAMTWLSTGYGFQMRYVGPLAPSLYMMLAGLLQCAHRRQRELILVSLLCIAYAAASGALYLLNADYHEMYSFLEWGGFVSFEP